MASAMAEAIYRAADPRRTDEDKGWTCAECGAPVPWGELWCSDGCEERTMADVKGDFLCDAEREDV